MADCLDAACLTLVHHGEEVPSLLWARRPDDAPALARFHVCPGGLVDASDGDMPNDGGSDVAARVSALRETFEEVGVLFAHGAERLREPEIEALRDALRGDTPAEGRARFRAHGLVWQTASLAPAGRWVTPHYARRRFDTRFFGLSIEGPLPVDPDLFELDHAEWIRADHAWARWARGEVMLAPPLAALLRSLDRHGRLMPDELCQVHGADGQECLRWEVVPWLQMMPLLTPTLPPATHTNAYLVGSGEAILVEPATPHAEELDRAVRWIEEARRDGIHPKAIVATHHHPDHVGGATALSERLGLPLWAHAMTAERLRGELTFERLLEDGERIHLDGPTPVTVRAVHTPGHAPGHLCFVEEASGAMLAGDMVASVGTILVEPHDGDMRLYLESLARMAAERPSMLLPAHGMPIHDAQALLSHYIEHRLAREAKVRAALERHGGPASAMDLVPDCYGDAPKVVWPLAAQSTEAHLIKLAEDGAATRAPGGWMPAPRG